MSLLYILTKGRAFDGGMPVLDVVVMDASGLARNHLLEHSSIIYLPSLFALSTCPM
jgi:hypothetical protein